MKICPECGFENENDSAEKCELCGFEFEEKNAAVSEKDNLINNEEYDKQFNDVISEIPGDNLLSEKINKNEGDNYTVAKNNKNIVIVLIILIAVVFIAVLAGIAVLVSKSGKNDNLSEFKKEIISNSEEILTEKNNDDIIPVSESADKSSDTGSEIVSEPLSSETESVTVNAETESTAAETEAETEPVPPEPAEIKKPLDQNGVVIPGEYYSDYDGYSHAIVSHLNSDVSLMKEADQNSEHAADWSQNTTVFLWGETGGYCYISDESMNMYGYVPSEYVEQGAYVPPEQKYEVYFSKDEIFSAAGVSDLGAHVIGGVLSDLSCSNGNAWAETEQFVDFSLLKGVHVSDASSGEVTISGTVIIYGVDRTASYEVERGYFSVSRNVG